MSIRRVFEQSAVSERHTPLPPKIVDKFCQKKLHEVPKPRPQLDFEPKLQSSETRTTAETRMRVDGTWISWSMPSRNSRSNAAAVVRQ